MVKIRAVHFGHLYSQVGRETINSSDDPILKQDMPAALHRVEGASKFLEEASAMLKGDPYSGPARYIPIISYSHDFSLWKFLGC